MSTHTHSLQAGTQSPMTASPVARGTASPTGTMSGQPASWPAEL